MKVSKYNIYVEHEGRNFVYNQLRSSLLEIDAELFQGFRVPTCDITSLDKSIIEELSANGIICDKMLKEENVVLANSKSYRFSNNTARVTILPTLDCNFHCWYCYEDHPCGVLASEDIEKVINFCKGVISNGNIKCFRLDWFGGEPLLYFDEVVYPISKSIQDFCKNEGVVYLNSITTNGYLITPGMIGLIKEINLNIFQITLDGGKRFHNKTRFSKDVKNSYDGIISNIVALCNSIADIDMTVRINYTPKNIDSLDEIAEAFPVDIRNKIIINPQLVWQFKKDRNLLDDKIAKKMQLFVAKGYKESLPDLTCYLCYSENMKQFVVNYDLSVFKCTARDFSSKYSIGKIGEEGAFIPNPHYYDYFISSAFENENCLACHLLPSCYAECIQRHMEGVQINCNKEQIEKDIKNRILLYLSKNEEC